MQSKSRGTIYLVTIGVFLLLFVIYRFGFKDRYLNMSTKTTIVDLSIPNRSYLIEKHADQSKIKHLELQIKGKLSENITLYLSTDGVQSGTSIRIKKGKVDTSFRTKWSGDNAYILIENLHESKSQLEIEYQFVTE